MSNKYPRSSPKINIGATRSTGDPEGLMLSIIVPVLNEEDSIESALENICEAIERSVVKYLMNCIKK